MTCEKDFDVLVDLQYSALMNIDIETEANYNDDSAIDEKIYNGLVVRDAA